MIRYILMVSVVIVLSLACSHEIETTETGSYKTINDTVTISPGSPIINQLEIQEVNAGSHSFDLMTSGKVKAIPNNYALVAAPFAGRITKSYVRLGQEVNSGTPIFEMSSPSYFETGKAYYQTKEELGLAFKNLKRQKDLLNENVGIQKDLEEAEEIYAIRKKDFENAFASLKVFQVDTSDFELGQPLIVRSPIKGRIVDNNIVIGQYIKEDSEPIATVAELSNIWVSGQVKEKDIRYIHDTSEVEIKLISFPEKVITGQIYHVNSTIDEDTRSVQVLIECNNSSNLMKPGMYVTVKFTHTIENVIVIPSKSVFQMDDASFVFLNIGKNRYLKRKIEILSEDNGSLTIKSGLNSGDRIIASGGYYLLEEK